MKVIRIEQDDLGKDLRVGDKIVALGGHTIPDPYEIVSLHPGRASCRNLVFPHLGQENLFYSANKSVTVEREEVGE
ncbi:hypothetical protein [Nonomuraea typhae]|uniref:Uncharacterized protein n=1 Tax=Nonomuraea typhae TaxID=2603600 RepID=A0ABW7YJ86_9ACTN